MELAIRISSYRYKQGPDIAEGVTSMWKKDYSTPLQFAEPEPDKNEDEATDIADVDEASE